MEADWEIQVGGEAPVIEAQWPGFVDLRLHPERAWQLPESVEFPAMAEALGSLNAAASPVWTSKCDIWPIVDLAQFDADELDAPPESAAHAMGCYIDLLSKGDGQWVKPAKADADCKRLCSLLHAVALRCCRLDLVIRRAFINRDLTGLGITAYLTACGPTEAEAKTVLQEALAAFADAFCDH